MVEYREKYIKRIGDSMGIIFNREEREIYDIKLGDLVKVSLKKEEENK